MELDKPSVHHNQAVQSDFRLQVNPGSYSLRLPIGTKSDISSLSLPRGKPLCASVFN